METTITQAQGNVDAAPVETEVKKRGRPKGPLREKVTVRLTRPVCLRLRRWVARAQGMGSTLTHADVVEAALVDWMDNHSFK